ncbi:putative disease resistance protein rpp1 [Quercus suber]|uniref:Disease resistance protein rpp1 n=1 Tax=Quercus suber TaxID=58331 RepID=A0AAW0JP71_QUESU
MSHSNIRIHKLFKPVLPFENLKRINLSGCESIQKLPKLWAPNLEILNLSHCTNLVEIHEPARFLDKLKIWYLTNCKKLRALPRRLKFKCLVDFHLQHCESIQELPELCAPNLEILYLSDCTNLVKVHESIGLLDKLEDLHLGDCGKLQTLPRRLPLKSLQSFDLSGCTSLENFPDIDSVTKCLRCLYMRGSGTSLERNFLDSIYKFQNVNVLSLSTNLPRPSCNSFDGCLGYLFLQLTELNLFGENVTELDFLDTITIPESFIKFTTLIELDIFDCKHFEEIQGLPQSLIHFKARNCPPWNPKSSSKILSQVFLYHSLALSYKEIIVLPFPKYLTRYAKLQVMAKKIAKWKQVGESQGVLADRVHEGDQSLHPLYHSIAYFRALGCEIPDEFNHRNDGNSISFLVRNSRCIPLAICVAFGPINESYHFVVEFVVNGCLEIQHRGVYLDGNESCQLLFISNPMYEWEKKLRDSNLSK